MGGVIGITLPADNNTITVNQPNPNTNTDAGSMEQRFKNFEGDSDVVVIPEKKLKFDALPFIVGVTTGVGGFLLAKNSSNAKVKKYAWAVGIGAGIGGIAIGAIGSIGLYKAVA